jgi:rRNA maturation protein Nop10
MGKQSAYDGQKGAVQAPGASDYGVKQCVVCGEQFAPSGPNTKSCSDRCKRIRRRQKSGQPTLPDVDELTATEIAVYERMIDGLPSDALVRARTRSVAEKRMDIILGMLNPMLAPPEGLDLDGLGLAKR